MDTADTVASRTSGLESLLASLFIMILALGGCMHRPPVDLMATDNRYHWMSWEIHEACLEQTTVFDKVRSIAAVYDETEEDD
jgi:hypothetical protein